MAASGEDIGASLSGSASSGASLSGATSQRGGGNYGGTSYGPGSLVNLDQSGSLGASNGGINMFWLVIIAGGLGIAWLFKH